MPSESGMASAEGAARQVRERSGKRQVAEARQAPSEGSHERPSASKSSHWLDLQLQIPTLVLPAGDGIDFELIVGVAQRHLSELLGHVEVLVRGHVRSAEGRRRAGHRI